MQDRWSALGTLVRARLVVALFALPVGLLLHPDASAETWWILAGALGVLAAVSIVFSMAHRMRRGLDAQVYAQLTVDLVAISALAAVTGGQESQFVLFFALVVITGGIFGRLPGGLFAAVGACTAYLAIPWLAQVLNGAPGTSVPAELPRPGMSIAFLTIVGVLAGVLGERVQRARADLVRTARELDRVRVDNDVILRHLTTGVLTVDGEGRVAYLNPAAEQVLGIRMADVEDQPISMLPARLSALRTIVLETLEQQSPRARAELMMATSSHRALPVGASTNLLRQEDQSAGVVAVFQDLTEVREMERRVRRNETLAEVGALAAGIAHELRNGLNPISGSVECLQRELTLDGENADLMALISRESSRLNRFVTDLLTYAKERELALESVGLNEHLADVCDVASRDARKPEGIAIRFEPGDDETRVQIDPEQMQQVWLNLATNAFQACRGEGEIVVRWTQSGDEGVLVEFEDNGSGIAEQDLARAGEPFFTTKEGGTGLGLAIAQRIVERHGGALTLHSAPGRGTTARVALLCSAGTPAVAA